MPFKHSCIIINMYTSKRSGTFSLGLGIPIRQSTITMIMMVIKTAKSLIVERTYKTQIMIDKIIKKATSLQHHPLQSRAAGETLFLLFKHYQYMSTLLRDARSSGHANDLCDVNIYRTREAFRQTLFLCNASNMLISRNLYIQNSTINIV